MPSRYIDTLIAQPLFSGCSYDELTDIASRAQLRVFRKGGTLMEQGDEGDSIYILLSGLARVSMVAANGRQIVLDYVDAGSILGEISVFDEKPRAVSARAVEPIESIFLPGSAIREIIGRYEWFALRLLQILAGRLRQTIAVIETDRAYAAEPRLARFLLRLVVHRPDAADGGGVAGPLRLELSQSELGNFAGLSREQINRQLATWAGQGLIALKNGRITVLDHPALLEVAQTL